MITKHFYSILGALCLLCALCVSCSQDDGNYDYLPDSEVSKIVLVVDSTRTLNPYAIYTMSAGDEIEYYLKVTYPYPERLRYNVFAIDGRPVLGNAKSLDGLAKGLYIVNGKKQYIK